LVWGSAVPGSVATACVLIDAERELKFRRDIFQPPRRMWSRQGSGTAEKRTLQLGTSR
jgi:hypothetical protein